MNDAESSQAAELDADHRDIDPSLGTGFGSFVITHQPAMAHQPAEGPFHHPAMGQYLEALVGIGTFDHLHGQFRAKAFDPLGKSLAAVTAVHPQDTQPGEPVQDSFQKHSCSVPFGGAGRSDGETENQSQSVHQQMPFAALDLFGSVITHAASVSGGLDALTVQNGRRWPAALAMRSANQDAKRIVNDSPSIVGDPLAEDVVNGFPVGKVGGQIAPRTAAFDQIEDGINDPPPVFGRASAFEWLGKHRLEISPLFVSKVSVVFSDFHRLTGATAKKSQPTRQQNQALSLFFRHALSFVGVNGSMGFRRMPFVISFFHVGVSYRI